MGKSKSNLTFRTLREANVNRMPEFKNKKGKPAHTKNDGSDWSKAEWLEAVIGELGEYANLAKKVRRGDYTEAEARQAIADELADVVAYLDILAWQYGFDLGAIVTDKFNRISDRVGSSIKIDDDWDLAYVEESKKKSKPTKKPRKKKTEPIYPWG